MVANPRPGARNRLARGGVEDAWELSRGDAGLPHFGKAVAGHANEHEDNCPQPLVPSGMLSNLMFPQLALLFGIIALVLLWGYFTRTHHR